MEFEAFFSTTTCVAVFYNKHCTLLHQSESEVAQSCLTLCDPMDCSLPGSSIHEIFQARVLEWGVIAFSEVQSRTQQIDQSKGWSQTIGAEYQFQVSQSMQNADLEYANQSNVHARS